MNANERKERADKIVQQFASRLDDMDQIELREALLDFAAAICWAEIQDAAKVERSDPHPLIGGNVIAFSRKRS